MQLIANDQDAIPLLTAKEAATLLAVSEQTLWRWRKSGEGPPFARVGGEIRYARPWLEKWVIDQAEKPRG